MIRIGDDLLHIRRRLSQVTTEEDALRIHTHMGTDKLLRGNDGQWYCCDLIKPVDYTEKDIVASGEIVQDFDQQGLS